MVESLLSPGGGESRPPRYTRGRDPRAAEVARRPSGTDGSSSHLVSSHLGSARRILSQLISAQLSTTQHRISRRGGSRRSPPPALAACVPTGTLLGSVRSGSVRFGFPSRGTANLGYAEELLGCLRCLCALHAAAFGGHRASSGGCDPVPTAQTGRDGTGRDGTRHPPRCKGTATSGRGCSFGARPKPALRSGAARCRAAHGPARLGAVCPLSRLREL